MGTSEIGSASSGLRQVARDAVRLRIADIAVRVFDERGFDAVTVEEVAAEVGVSARTFHRYFPAKEDAVLVDAAFSGDLVRAQLSQRPTDEDPWASLRAALEPLVRTAQDDDGRSLRAMRVLMSTPALRAKNHEKHASWSVDLVEILRRHGELNDGQASALVGSALACFDEALKEWVQHDGSIDLADALDLMFDAVGYRR